MSKFKKSSETVESAETVENVETVPVEDSIPTVAFNVWFAMREKKIPARHLREIILADFKGQGVSGNETIAAFDKALARYGIKLS